MQVDPCEKYLIIIHKNVFPLAVLLPIEFILLPHAQILAVTENLIKTDTSMMHT